MQQRHHLLSSILQNIDIISYRSLSIIRIKIESQKAVSYIDNKCFIREGSHTKSVTGRSMEEVFKRFNIS